MASRSLFQTLVYEASLESSTKLIELVDAARSIARDDHAGRQWSRDHRYPGYTSYASLNDLPKRDPRIADLVRVIDRHVRRFVVDCAFDMKQRPKLDSLWVNILKSGGGHSGHIHPHSVISGTFYIEIPSGSGALRLEDPRLPMMMAAPLRRDDAPEALRSFVSIQPEPGTLLLWESWLRHEVMPGAGKGERISISFNYS